MVQNELQYLKRYQFGIKEVVIFRDLQNNFRGFKFLWVGSRLRNCRVFKEGIYFSIFQMGLKIIMKEGFFKVRI